MGSKVSWWVEIDVPTEKIKEQLVIQNKQLFSENRKVTQRLTRKETVLFTADYY